MNIDTQPDTQTRVLITGMSGLIGSAVRRHLEKDYLLTALNRTSLPGIKTFQADIADFEAIQPAFENQDIVVHLAASKGGEWPIELQSNIIGTYNIFEACRQAGVRRVIFASSGATISGWQREQPYADILAGNFERVPPNWDMITHETPIRSWSLYGATKVWGEAVARHFSDSFGISIICLRIAVVTAEDRPTSPEMAPVWCSQRDVATMVRQCIEAPPELMFDIFNVVSNNKWGFRDLDHARKIVGYEPQDSADEYWP